MRSWNNRIAELAFALILATALPRPLGAQMTVPEGAPPMEVVKVRFPDYNSDGTLKREIFGDRALIQGDLITIFNLRVEIYEEGKLVTTLWAEKCLYNKVKGIIDSDSPVRLMRSGLVITGDGMDWSKNNSVVTLRRNVRIVAAGTTSWFKQEHKQ